MKVLIGTTNPSKVEQFAAMLSGFGLEFITLADLGIADEPKESGRTPGENAGIKAAFYGQYAENVICADSGLYFDCLALDDSRQPGLHVRTPGGGKRLDDEEMIAYYANLAHSLGGKVMAYYLDGAAVMAGGKVFTFQETREEARAKGFYIVDVPSAERREGWPIDSVSLMQDGTYFLDPNRKVQVQQTAAYKPRLRAFLLASMGL